MEGKQILKNTKEEKKKKLCLVSCQCNKSTKIGYHCLAQTLGSSPDVFPLFEKCVPLIRNGNQSLGFCWNNQNKELCGQEKAHQVDPSSTINTKLFCRKPENNPLQPVKTR